MAFLVLVWDVGFGIALFGVTFGVPDERFCGVLDDIM